MDFRRIRCAIGAVAVTGLAPLATAEAFNDLESFLAAARGARLVNFDALPSGLAAAPGPIGMQYGVLGLSFPPANLITESFAGPVSPPNGWLNDTVVGSDHVFDVDITIPGVRAVGVRNVRLTAPNKAVLTALDSSGRVLDSVISDADQTTPDFYGVTTGADIARVTIAVRDGGAWGLDDLWVGDTGAGGTGLDIRVDLGISRGQTGGNWNNIGDVAGRVSGLIDFNTGAPTSVSYDADGPWFDAGAGSLTSGFPEQAWLIQPAVADGAWLQTGPTGSIRLTGLTGPSYRVEVVSARSVFDYRNTFMVNGDLADRTFLGTPVATPWGSASHGLADGNWLVWDNVAPSGGEIRIVDMTDVGDAGIINALRILETDPAGPSCYADCDGNGVLDFFDFLCFQNAFAAGCP